MVIKSLNIDISFNTTISDNYYKEQVDTLCNEHIIPALDKQLQPYSNSDQRLAIDHLELDLGTITAHYRMEDIENIIVKLIEEKLPAPGKNNIIQTKGKDQLLKELPLSRIQEAFIYYLKYGRQPWWSTIKDPLIFESECKNCLTTLLSEKIITIVNKEKPALQRLIYSFSDDLLIHLIRQVEVKQIVLERLKKLTQSNLTFNKVDITSKQLRIWYWEAIFSNYKYLQSNNSNIILTESICREVLAQIRAKGTSFRKGQTVESLIYLLLQQISEVLPILTSKEVNTVVKLLKSDKRYTEFDKQKTIIQKNVKKIQEYEVQKRSQKKDPKREVEQERSAEEMVSGDNDMSIEGKANTSIPEHTMPDAESITSERDENIVEDTSGEYVHHAGLVLLHVFLTSFFKRLNLLEGNKWKSSAHQERGVQLLSFITVGESFCPEYEMVLAKHLCGLAWTTPISPHLDLSDHERGESDALLTSVIDQWSALKNTSIDGLRQGFLQRDGKLIKKQNGWNLFIEQDSRDILLSRLPWGLSMIHLPWLDHLIFVNWT